MKTSNTENNKLRLIYARFRRNFKFGALSPTILIRGYASPVYRLPSFTTMEEACNIISYISMKVEKENHLEAGSIKSIIAVERELENYGFTPVKDSHREDFYSQKEPPLFKKIKFGIPQEKDVSDIITYETEDFDFKNVDIEKRCFNWFNPDVTEKQIGEIYSKIDERITSNINSNFDSRFDI